MNTPRGGESEERARTADSSWVVRSFLLVAPRKRRLAWEIKLTSATRVVGDKQVDSSARTLAGASGTRDHAGPLGENARLCRTNTSTKHLSSFY